MTLSWLQVCAKAKGIHHVNGLVDGSVHTRTVHHGIQLSGRGNHPLCLPSHRTSVLICICGGRIGLVDLNVCTQQADWLPEESHRLVPLSLLLGFCRVDCVCCLLLQRKGERGLALLLDG